MPNPISLFRSVLVQKPSAVGLTNAIPPTFAGIASLLVQADGGLLASWAAASDADGPIRYNIYIGLNGAPASLFVAGNLLCSVLGTSFKIFETPDGNPLARNTRYYVGVRARDAVGNEDSNLVVRDDLSIGPVGGNLTITDIPAIAQQVWQTLRADVDAPNTFGEALQGVLSPARANLLDLLDRLDVEVSTRASALLASEIDAGIDELLVRLSNARAGRLDYLDAPITSRGDATAANQASIAAAVASKASQASVNTLQTSVNNIPTNPLLTNDSRLNNLDATISSRLSQTNFDVIKGGGFNAATDSLEAIRDAVSGGGADLTPVLNALTDIKGAGFDTNADALSKVRPKVEAAKTSADAAASSALDAKNAALAAATQAQAATIIAGVAAIPTTPLLSTDPRVANLDAAISTRAAATVLAQAMGGTFNPATDSLEAITDLINSKTYGNATQAKQDQILNALAGAALEATAQSILTRVTSIPTNPLLTNDARLNNLDATISSRATDNDMQAIKGVGFNGTTDSLAAISAAAGGGSTDLTPVLASLADIKGSGFVSGQHDLATIQATAQSERAALLSEVQSILSQAEGV